MTNEPQNNDSYREIISEEDLGESLFPSFSEKEEILPIKEVTEKPAPTINLSSSIRDSAFKEEEPEIVKEETKPVSDFTISEDLMGEPIKEEVPEIIQKTEEVIFEKSGIVVQESINEPIKEETPEIVPEKVEETIKEEVVSRPEPEIVKEQVPEPIKEEVILKPVLSYREVRDDLYGKVSPRNINRFKELGLEENIENKRFLDGIAIKINFLDDDLEEKAISEEEALLKLQNLLTK